jgi:phage tail tape-measure protein
MACGVNTNKKTKKKTRKKKQQQRNKQTKKPQRSRCAAAARATCALHVCVIGINLF